MAEERLVVGVDFDVASAVKNLNAVVGSVDTTRQSVNEFKESVESADKALIEVGRVATETAKHVSTVGTEAETAAKKTKEMATSTRAAGKEQVDAAKKGGEATEETTKKTDLLTAATGKLQSAVKGIGVTYMGMKVAQEIMAAVEERTRKLIEASDRITGRKLEQEKITADVVDNLGLPATAAGQAKAREVVEGFRLRTGASAEQAVAVLSQAQSTGVEVFDAKTGKVNKGGMDMAATLGTFAARLRLDSESAGKLFNIAQLAGATKKPEDFDKFLAQIEAAQKQSPIQDPAKYVSGLITASAPLLTQGVSFSQALGQYGAATLAQPEAAMAATNVSILGRVAGGAGAGEEQRLFLAKKARDAGRLPKDRYDAFLREEMAKGQTEHGDEIKRLDRDAGEAETDEAQSRKQEDERIRQLEYDAEKRVYRGRDAREQRTRAKESLENERAKVERDRRERAERLQDTRDRAAKAKAAMQKKAEDEAAMRAYKTLTASDQQNILYDMTAGMNQEQLTEFMRNVAPGDMANQTIGQLSNAARQTRTSIIESTDKVDVKQFTQAQAGYLASSSLARGGLARAADDAAAARAARPGGDYVSSVSKMAETNVDVLRQQGQGAAGFWAFGIQKTEEDYKSGGIVGAVVGSQIDAMGLRKQTSADTMNAGSEQGLQAMQIMQIVNAHAGSLLNNMTPEQRKRHPEVQKFIDMLAEKTPEIVAQARTWGRGGRSIKRARNIAAQFGVISETVMAEAADRDEAVPEFLNNASLVNPMAPSFPSKAPAAPASPAPSPAKDAPTAPAAPVPAAPAADNEPAAATDAAQPAAAPGHASVIYNVQHIGQVFSTDPLNTVFDGRLEGRA